LLTYNYLNINDAMKIKQKQYSKTTGWKTTRNDNLDAGSCHLVIAFGSTGILSDPGLYSVIRSNYPKAHILMNSTSGEIHDVSVSDDTVSLTAIQFEKTKVKTASVKVSEVKSGYEAARLLAAQLEPVDLKNVIVISDGQSINGSELVSGLQKFLPEGTIITGGLAGDGKRYKKTLVGLNESPKEGRVVALGFYGKNLSITYGSVGGWDSYGSEGMITKSQANVLFEIDKQPALDFYKNYLGPQAKYLPDAGLLYPFSIRLKDSDDSIVRTILNVDEEMRSITFAGNMPQGSFARVMKANPNHLIRGASNAATDSMDNITQKPDLAILISCIGRKLVLNTRIREEVEVIRSIYGRSTAITGFYSYGEISHSVSNPDYPSGRCELHNQTMTITTLTEN
jgi:hypothetical protein